MSLLLRCTILAAALSVPATTTSTTMAFTTTTPSSPKRLQRKQVVVGICQEEVYMQPLARLLGQEAIFDNRFCCSF